MKSPDLAPSEARDPTPPAAPDALSTKEPELASPMEPSPVPVKEPAPALTEETTPVPSREPDLASPAPDPSPADTVSATRERTHRVPRGEHDWFSLQNQQ